MEFNRCSRPFALTSVSERAIRAAMLPSGIETLETQEKVKTISVEIRSHVLVSDCC